MGDGLWFVQGRGRKWLVARETEYVDVGAAFVGLVLGLVVGPLADRLATNAPVKTRRLLERVPRSRWVWLVTAATALLAAACGLDFGFTAAALIGAFFCWILVVVTLTDFEHRLIPDRIVLPGAVAVLVARTLDDPSVGWILAGIGAGFLLFLIVLVYPKGLGMGDVKLAAFMGVALGSSVAVALFLGFLAAFIPAAVLFQRRGRAALKQGIPLGPFLALGGVIALFAGDAILDWYTRIGH
jgi:leader peptidase (prepilin peptidase)/N-methyltransferase